MPTTFTGIVNSKLVNNIFLRHSVAQRSAVINITSCKIFLIIQNLLQLNNFRWRQVYLLG